MLANVIFQIYFVCFPCDGLSSVEVSDIWNLSIIHPSITHFVPSVMLN